MNDPQVFTSLASNGPWAMAAAFLLWKILGAWSEDRKALSTLLTDFKGTLDGLKVAVQELTQRLEEIEKR